MTSRNPKPPKGARAEVAAANARAEKAEAVIAECFDFLGPIVKANAKVNGRPLVDYLKVGSMNIRNLEKEVAESKAEIERLNAALTESKAECQRLRAGRYIATQGGQDDTI